jgi:NTP pyrophosphatase (non-canonical NTP hydrolase)
MNQKQNSMTSNFSNYTRFVNTVTSNPSKDSDAFIYRLQELGSDVAIQRLLTASVGISAESGEFMEIVKKMIFQGKPCNEDNLEHLKIELGDIMWYVAQACLALEVDMDDVLDTNIKKLEKRYPDGHFAEFYSENRKANDR